MLVFISDLHFVDETAGKHNIPAPAFEKFLAEIKIHAEKTAAGELKIVFLGDIFDLLRTEEWFMEKEADRPWGNNTERMRKRALEILKAIEEKNSATFELFQPAALKKRFREINVETVYVPGNHDRLCWLLDDLKEKVIKMLGLKRDNDENFKHHFSCTRHGVYALHGHCFDEFNYEGGPDRTYEDYKLVPIGDPITTELIAKLPYRLMINVEKRGNLGPEEKEHLKRNFQEIENVRPYSAVLKWLLYQVRARGDIKDIIEDTVDEVVQEFNELEFVKKWYGRHDRWHNPFDSADRIQGILFFLEKFKVFSMGRLMEMAKRISGLFAENPLAEGAAGLFSRLDNRIQHVVMGHTHVPLKEALSTGRNDGRLFEHVYLNCGTWRKRYHECRDRSGFIGWKNMTYNIIYTPEEKPNRQGLPVFESWSGALKRDL